uniref:Sec-independent protein translocase protein TatB n=1 Tax=Candidatus Kentrum sp. DK TaxID=2126562 RepID=A0A450SFS4_9GAMM|nr:MAG: sec-independent protein translocase protein TatB [Candidatus Kentron sp. DK]
MFDIGFWELTLIAIIALVVIGPERLPEFARTAGFWIGKARRLFTNVKNDIDRELRADELRRMIKPQELEQIHEIIEETKTTVTDAGVDLSEISSPNSPSDGSSINSPEFLSADSNEKSGSNGTQSPRS